MTNTINQIALQNMPSRYFLSGSGRGRHASRCCLWHRPREPDIGQFHTKIIDQMIKQKLQALGIVHDILMSKE